MINQKQAVILGCKVDMVDMQQSLARIEEIVREKEPSQIITLNAEIAYKAQNDPSLTGLINSAGLVTPDGIGIIWAARILGYSLKERVTGIDMLYRLCETAAQKGFKVYLLGAAPGVAQIAGESLVKRYPGLEICGIHHGFFKEGEDKNIIKDIELKSPDILLVGLGAPKQEYWIKNNLNKIKVPACIGVGGSFDVIAGIKKRAPDLLIRLNLEWLFRLISEPKRFRRQLVLPKFVFRVLKEKYF
jgi:N-acetylglucosaminyldiphosphoundecaprenol N-acetyl-beta-D-mannosaminyltransferase